MDERVSKVSPDSVPGVQFTPEQHRRFAIAQYKSMDASNKALRDAGQPEGLQWGGERYADDYQ